jgi:hypothetical protein
MVQDQSMGMEGMAGQFRTVPAPARRAPLAPAARKAAAPRRCVLGDAKMR